MAHENKVIRSINLEGGSLCVDIFMRPDGTYGYDEYRRDAEDGRGWFCIGHFAGRIFASADAALAEARQTVGWLD